MEGGLRIPGRAGGSKDSSGVPFELMRPHSSHRVSFMVLATLGSWR
jgi:hypothetical protein